MTDHPTFPQRCPVCDGPAHLVRETREVRYGRRRVLVEDEFMRCSACRETFYVAGQMAATDARAAERARQEHAALLPFEIRAIRERHELTQRQFEQLIGVGPKTAVRWESGTIVPNPATNTLLRLLQADPRSVERLLEWSGLHPTSTEEAATRPHHPHTWNAARSVGVRVRR